MADQNTPDPQLVREIARGQILNHAKNLAQEDVTIFESVIEKDICIPLSVGEQEDLADAVLAEIGKAQVTVSWPDEQQAQDERDADVRAVVRAIQEIAAATNCYPPAVASAIGALNKHFASRIVALDARMTDGGAA